MRRLYLAIALLGWFPPAALAGPFEWFDGLPNTYLPGATIGFDLRLPALTNLGVYNIDLVLESSTGIAGEDFFFDVVSTTPSTSAYLFPTTDYFFDAVNIEPPTRHRITLTDFYLPGADIVPGLNDLVAHVVLGTSSSFSGAINLSVDASALILSIPAATPSPVDGFLVVQSGIAAAGPLEIMPVPEPSGGCLIIIGLLVGCSCRRSSNRPHP